MMDLKNYQERRELLCAWYDRVIEADELLQADVNALQEAKSNLVASRFVVAICGGMNSGKSTLLNALLFSDEILPSHVTTMTAKIALMEGGIAERIEATLYTPDEFQRVREACSSDTQAAAELNEARNIARAQGLKEGELLTDPAHVISVEDLRGLDQFAAVCDQGGIYSIYVKEVRLWADRPWLHEVTVADTPGTGDPNPERDKITREWIQQADAVVYVTFAGQAGMTAEDVKFIDEHLAHIDPSRRIIAVNKCDLEPNAEAIWNHIEKIRNSDLRMKNLFGNEDQIVLVSGLGALVSEMQRVGHPLSEDMEWHVEQLSDKGYLDPERHGLEKLRDLVERHIIATKGDGIIESHQLRLDSVFESAVTRLSQDVEVLENNIEAVNASKEERKEEHEKVNESIASISSHVGKARVNFDKKLDDHGVVLDEAINEASKKASQGVAEDIRKVQNIDNLAVQALWSLQQNLHDERGSLTKSINLLVREIEIALNEAEDQLSATLLASGLGTRISQTHLLPVSARTICKDAEARLIENLDRDDLSKTIREAADWFQRFFNTKGGLKAAVEALKPELEKTLGEALNEISEYTLRELRECGQEALKSMEESCSSILKRQQELLKELENENLSDEKRKTQLNEKLKEGKEQKLQIEKLQAEYREEMNS